MDLTEPDRLAMLVFYVFRFRRDLCPGGSSQE